MRHYVLLLLQTCVLSQGRSQATITWPDDLTSFVTVSTTHNACWYVYKYWHDLLRHLKLRPLCSTSPIIHLSLSAQVIGFSHHTLCLKPPVGSGLPQPRGNHARLARTFTTARGSVPTLFLIDRYWQYKNLIWSGACLFGNRNIFDFKAINISAVTFLSFLVGRGHTSDIKGSANIYNSDYQPFLTLNGSDDSHALDFHEFKVLESGETALIVTKRNVETMIGNTGRPTLSSVKVISYGFREVGVKTGEVFFDWDAMDHIPISESLIEYTPEAQTEAKPWDYVWVLSKPQMQHTRH